MIRPALSYVLSSLILLTQVGIPLHKHYCKGMLESVSVFYAQKCDDHGSPAAPDACCKSSESTNCTTEDNPCCSDEVTVVSQQASYVPNSLAKWMPALLPSSALRLQNPLSTEQAFINFPSIVAADAGPPLYILHQSLIIYA